MTRPFSISSVRDITDWDSIQGVGANVKTPTNILTAAHGAVGGPEGRWLAVGTQDFGLPAGIRPFFSTSDDDGVTWTGRGQGADRRDNVVPRTAIWSKDASIFAVGGDRRSMQVSANGTAWVRAPISSTIPGGQSFRDLVEANGGDAPYLYAGCFTSNFLIRSPNLATSPPENTWSASTISYVSATGTKHMASGAQKVISIGNFDTDMEIAETVHGSLSGASVGAIASYNCAGITFGNDLWVAVSNDFRIVTCASGDEGIIGNWSAPSTSKAAGVTVLGIKYDGGSDVIGPDDSRPSGIDPYGYIVHGVDGSGNGVIYTSPDAVTWTLRHTQVEAIDITALAVRYPEEQLASQFDFFTFTDFLPQAPTLIGDSFEHWSNIGPKQPWHIYRSIRGVEARTGMTVRVTDAGAEIGIGGWDRYDPRWSDPDVNPSCTLTQCTDEPGNFNQAPIRPVFTLNEKPDFIRIRLDIRDVSTSALRWGADPLQPETSTISSTFIQSWGAAIFAGALAYSQEPGFDLANLEPSANFTANLFFRPLDDTHYGIAAFATAAASSPQALIDGVENNGGDPVRTVDEYADLTVSFTFRKEGFNDLTRTYRYRARARARAGTIGVGDP